MGIAVIEGTAVVRAHHKEAGGFCVKAGQYFLNTEEIAQAFGHFLVVAGNKAVMHPVAGQGLSAGGLALRDFVFVVGKGQIRPAAVDVKRLAQQFARHGRALDMPARPAGAVGAVPFSVIGLGGLGSFPQHKVQRVALALVHRDAFAGAQLVDGFARELAVAFKFTHSKVHILVAGTVGVALGFQGLNQTEHLRHEGRSARLVGRALYTQSVGIAVQIIDHAVGERLDGFTIVQRPADDFVVNIGDVAHISHLIATGLEPALHHIKGEHGAGVAQVAIVIHRHAAYIHAHTAGLDGGEIFQLPGQGIMKSQTHGNLSRLSLTWHFPQPRAGAGGVKALATQKKGPPLQWSAVYRRHFRCQLPVKKLLRP